ncbi:nucleoside-diphosphate sugar epimerase [Rhodobacteraceae bacterium RKSG542]|uniref:mitochondrial fission ELM1 family protein n=1 Tax=Pseudovibrio flavus TaxID=2529854 RepID=UPI0012BBDAAD|nr:mitochondrial fission ELM1 family protein [Pseudovibrio flavus]MTI19074.1 nucleoside-diphosphate sugar epimerase [Pseudovibrio flavus]
MAQYLWVITDGKAGDETQCLAVANELGGTVETRRVTPRRLFALAMPRGPIDPKDRPSEQGSPIAPPYPDIAIASGRRAVPYLRAIKKYSGGKTFTVFLKDPRTGTKDADFIWVPEHDGLRGENVLATLTSPHRFSAQALEQARQNPWPEIAALPLPKLAVLVGGNSRHHTFTDADSRKFAEGLAEAGNTHSLMITCSRRTPEGLQRKIAEIAASGPHLLWNGTGENPMLQYLAGASGIVVTADSANMVSEAAATGKPIYVFAPTGGHEKLKGFLSRLEVEGITHPFPGPLDGPTYTPIDATPLIASAIRSAMEKRG